MEGLRLIVGVILPYVAFAVFIGGMIYRIRSWQKLPSPAMTLFPAPATGKENLLNTVKEALLFKSLFSGDRVLWTMAWFFHVVLALVCLGHFRVFFNVDKLLMGLGMSEESIHAMSSGAGGAAGIVILATAVFLLLRRLLVPRAREITGASDYFALLLVGVIILTGNMMRFGAEHLDLTMTRTYFAGLARFADVTGEAALQNSKFLIHMCLACVLIIYIPFSKILHFGGIFFTHELIRKH